VGKGPQALISYLQTNKIWVLLLFIIVAGRVWLASYIPVMEFTEARYAEIARKAFVLDQWIPLWYRDDQPFWGKPPLAFWSTTLSYYAFGVSELATRLPSILYTAATMLVISCWLRLLDRTALILPVCFVYSSFFMVLQSAGTILTDPLMTLCTTTVMLAFWQCLAQEKPPVGWSILLWSCLGIGLLTKGPVVLVLCGLPCGVWALTQGRFLKAFRNTWFLPGIVLMLLIASPWYYLQEQRTPGFLEYFLIGEHFYRFTEPGWEGDLYGAAKDQPIGMIWLFLLIGLVPWLFIILWELIFRRDKLFAKALAVEKPLSVYLGLWLLMPTLFFTFAGNIIPTYVIPMLPSAAILLVMATTLRPAQIQWLGFVFAVFFFVLLLTAYEFYFKSHKYNQKPVIDEYHRLNKLDPGPLHYTGAETFSFVFYGGGVATHGRVWPDSGSPNTKYIAVRDMWIKSFEPRLKVRCTKQMQQGDVSFWYCPSINKNGGDDSQ